MAQSRKVGSANLFLNQCPKNSQKGFSTLSTKTTMGMHSHQQNKSLLLPINIIFFLNLLMSVLIGNSLNKQTNEQNQ